MDHLRSYGPLLQKVTLTQCEFLHPQSLIPLCNHCPNLAQLSVYGCSPISDDLFVGELPDLPTKPFSQMRELTYEGLIPDPLARFLLGSCSNLETLKLRVNKEMSFSVEILRILTNEPRRNLREVFLSFDRCQSFFLPSLRDFIAASENLERLEIFCGDHTKKDALDKLAHEMRKNNYDLEFLYYVRSKPRS